MTKSRSLSENQLANLSKKFASRLDTLEWRSPLEGESEPTYTGSVLLPSATTLIAEVETPGLVVRADGGVAPRPVSLVDVSFYPDLEIAYFDARSLAVEVKFVRDADATGSISKAIGQALIYRSGGFPWVHVVLVDCRTRRRPEASPIDMQLPAGVVVHLVSPNASAGAKPMDSGMHGPINHARTPKPGFSSRLP